MNVVALIGNAASDPELRYTQAGKAVATFRLAVSRGGGDEADFFSVVCWERQAEVVNEYVSTGRRVGIEGRLHHSTWDTENGKRSKVEVVAHRVELLGGPREGGVDTSGPAHTAPAAAPQRAQQAAMVPDDDDIPFG